MATLSIPSTLAPAQLSQAREAFVAHADAAADRAMRGCEQVGMPYRLIEASCYLTAAGVAAPACRAEVFYGWDIATTRRYLDGLSPTARQQEIEAGYKALFEGKRAIAPGVLDVAAKLIEAADRFDKLRTDTAREADEWETKRVAAQARHWAKHDAGREAA